MVRGFRWHLTKTIHLQTIITLICIIVFFIPLISISTYYYFSLKNTVYGNIHQDIQNIVVKTNEALSNNVDNVVSTYYSIISDPILNPELYRTLSPNTPYTSENITESIISDRLTKLMMYNVAWTNGLIKSVTYYMSAENRYSYKGSSYIYLKEKQKTELEQLSQMYLHQDSGHVCLYQHSAYDHSIIYYIRDFHRPDTQSGGLVILQMAAEKLAENYQLIDKYEGAFGILSLPDGTILSSTKLEICAQPLSSASVSGTSLSDILSDTKNYLIQKDHLEKENLDSIVIIPMQPLRTQLWKNIKNYVYLLFLCMLIIGGICILLPRYVSAYVSLLIQKMKLIRQGDYNIQLAESYITEFNDLNHNFSYMSSEIQRLIHEVYDSQLLLKDAQIQALQSQINPHFLFNILLCISWKAKANNDNEVSSMITALSILMRANIFSDDNLKTTIEKEVEICRLYLELQQYRFGKKLQFEIEMEPSIASYLIPKLTVQPIVENAVVHGLEKKIDDGFIRISVKTCDLGIEIEVFDNGPGCPFQDPDEIVQSPQNIHFHVGLKNCKQRIKHIYGDPYGLTLESIPQEYTKVKIYIPIDKENTNVPDCNCR